MRPNTWTYQDLVLLYQEFPVRKTAEVADMLGRSVTAVSVKASQLVLEKRPGFLEDRRRDITELAREGLKRTHRTSGRFKKGVRSNPAGEFKPGHVESPETKAKRSAALKASWKYRKQREELRKHGINI